LVEFGGSNGATVEIGNNDHLTMVDNGEEGIITLGNSTATNGIQLKSSTATTAGV
jgi:hypothetical protein